MAHVGVFPVQTAGMIVSGKQLLKVPSGNYGKKNKEKNPTYDMLEVEELGYISQNHFQDFIKFIRKDLE